jgi:hypothetical protein
MDTSALHDLPTYLPVALRVAVADGRRAGHQLVFAGHPAFTSPCWSLPDCSWITRYPDTIADELRRCRR